ncbi:CDGSH iron-sulfur domain-containing protein 1-like isoform X1 [Hypanus sabinus]|uniref:CDGSH iron-sulfur domain-containing protein 1-like isoform X1 n=1 Tax=Hypanus sabinus TaxID=79690 RepID=UPI0028C38714|nr:CDGSH iron-sulfur domain-containing protein 1-like isoform X1 [Hypanus sabinus]
MGAVGRQIRPLSVTAGSAMAARGARWAIIPYGLTIGVMVSGYFLYHLIKSRLMKNRRVNPAIDKYILEVVHNFDVEDLDIKTCFCRCWRSNKFPYCDGSHRKHNSIARDNVGPLIITKMFGSEHTLFLQH